MPAYNCSKFIEQSIESILNQTYPNIELLVADDASTDTTRKVIDKYQDKRIKRFHQPENLGYLLTCNQLFEKTSGEFIAFQDADDFSDVTRLEKQLQFLYNHPEVGVCGTNLTAISEHGKKMFCSRYETSHQEVLNYFINKDYNILPNSFLLRREVYNVIGGYHEYFNRIGAEDYYWTWLIMEKFQLANLSDPLYYYRYNPHSISGDWADNPKKIHTAKLLEYIILKRYRENLDVLHENNRQVLAVFEKRINQPYDNDPSLFYREISTKFFYNHRKYKAIKVICKAIFIAPFELKNWKDLFYYLKKL